MAINVSFGNNMARIGRNPEYIDPEKQSFDRAKMMEMIAERSLQEIVITMDGKTLCVIKEGEKEKPIKKKPKKRAPKKPSKKLEKYLNNTVAKAPNARELYDAVLSDAFSDKPVTYCGEDINMNIHAKSAPYKGYTSDSGVDVNKEFQKALDKGKKYGMHLSNKGGDPFLSEIEKLGNFDPLKGKI